MCSRAFIYLVGAVFIYYQVHAVEEIYIAELMVESNITLESQTILSVVNATTDLQVNNVDGTAYTVKIVETELIAECLIIKNWVSCNCSEGYIWSNDVCYNTTSCCREVTCNENVASFSPLCVAKVNVYINGSVTLSGSLWDSTKTDQLTAELEKLNGFEGLNLTGEREGNTIADFEAVLSVVFETSRLQTIITNLEMTFGASLLVDTLGLVTMEAPTKTLCYLAEPTLSCMHDELTDSTTWTVSKPTEHFELNTGSVVEMHPTCASVENPSCARITLHKVTGNWEGKYECAFTVGSVRHKANTELKVALLPDEITMKVNPLTADCSEKQSTEWVYVMATATILNSTEKFAVTGFYRDALFGQLDPEPDGDNLIYTVTAKISCAKSPDSHYVRINFKNHIDQEKSGKVEIPALYAGAPFCSSEVLNGQEWPKTPDKDTVINRTCEEGRVGYKMRSCENGVWQPVFSSCVNVELAKVLNAAENFRKGLGATQEVAMDIFAGLKNRSQPSSSESSEDDMADLSASIGVLNVMASASENVVLDEEVFPDLVDAASTMLNQSWGGVNESIKEGMSSNYLSSLEGLVKHIKVNKSSGLNSANLDLKFCSESDCQMSVFDIEVNMNRTSGLVKTVGVKNLMDKLRNNYHNTESTSLLLSATLVGNNDSSIQINLEFPKDMKSTKKAHCVFWNTTLEDWSDKGCVLSNTDQNHTVCICNHLTSFSVLMSKNADALPFLDEITYVGLGVSLCSLLILLIVESLVWSAVVKSNLSHFRHTSLVNISVCLLLADLFFLASTSPDILPETWCLVFTICQHFFFLAMFCWMLCLSVMLVHQLIFVFNPLRKRVFMFFSSIIGYVVPILIVGSSYVYYKYTGQPYRKKGTCWLNFNGLLDGSMHAFLLPVGAIVFTNIFSMGVVVLTLVKSSIPDGSKSADKETAKSILKVIVFLTPVFGVTWTLGFFMLFVDGNDPSRPFFVYSFTILNSLQGFFILLTGCFAEQKVREEVFRLIMGSKGNSENPKNTTYTKDK